MSRAAMEQARYALELCRLNGSQYLYGNERDVVFSALAALDAALAEQAQPEQPRLKQTFTRSELLRAIEAERHACSIAVWMTLQQALAPDADDLGLDGWMREAEASIKRRSANDPETTPPAPVAPPGWHPISVPYEPGDEIDIMLSDGSILCAVLPQFDGDLWWGGDGTGEKFIDPKHANVTHWRLHAAAAPEAPTPPAPQPLTARANL